MVEKAEIMDSGGISRAVARIAHEIVERNPDVRDLAFVGIQRRGVPLAKMIARKVGDFESREIPIGVLDITFHRDDLSLLSEHPIVNDTDIGFSVNDKKIILVDDVIYTGRTTRAAIETLMDLGRPRLIQLAVLIDRGHRELPFKAEYVGKYVPTSRTELVIVRLGDIDGVNQVTISDIYAESDETFGGEDS
jgi:pyrimidine operon attenuation protein/uracil phosphoribosyltransferase